VSLHGVVNGDSFVEVTKAMSGKKRMRRYTAHEVAVLLQTDDLPAAKRNKTDDVKTAQELSGKSYHLKRDNDFLQ